MNDCERKLSNDLHALQEKVIALRELMDERDKRYAVQFDAGSTAVSTALAAQKELTSAAFASSEKANAKTEDAQSSYNERTNELRGAMSDQSKTLLARSEAEARFSSVEEKIEENKKQVASLRESRSSGSGRDQAQEAFRTLMKWLVGTAITVLIFGFGAALTITLFVLKR
jgi:chromosome segregation ATPase